MASTKANTAPIKWAQRSDSLYITIALQGEYNHHTVEIF